VTATDIATVNNYKFGDFTNTFTIANNTADAVTGGSGVDTLVLTAASLTGTSDLKDGRTCWTSSTTPRPTSVPRRCRPQAARWP